MKVLRGKDCFLQLGATICWTVKHKRTLSLNLAALCVCSRPAVALIRKLIAVLESIERLPLHLYDTPGSSYNLQVSHSVTSLKPSGAVAVLTCTAVSDLDQEVKVSSGASAG